MYAALVKHITLPFYERRRGSDLLQRMKKFQASQWLSTEALREM